MYTATPTEKLAGSATTDLICACTAALLSLTLHYTNLPTLGDKALISGPFPQGGRYIVHVTYGFSIVVVGNLMNMWKVRHCMQEENGKVLGSSQRIFIR